MNLFRNVTIGGVIAIFSVVILAAIGWVLNIIKLFGLAQAADPNYVMAVLRGIGIIVAPLGAILGFL